MNPTEVQTWLIERLQVKDRARSDLGDLSDLKESLKKLGQLQPIAAEPDGTLLFGERRLTAMREIGETEIAVNVIEDLSDLDKLLVEQDENTCRLEMSPADKTRLFDRIKAVQKRLTPTGAAAHRSQPKSEKFSHLAGESEARKSRDKAAKRAGISHASARKVREVREAAEDETAPPEVREEAQRQYETLSQPGAKVDSAHKAVKRAKEKAKRKTTLKSGLGPGQWLEPPKPKIELTLTRRLVDGINKSQGIKKLAAEITDQDLDLDIATIYALRNRMRDEIRDRTAMKDALDQQIEKRGYDKRKGSPR